MLIAGQGQPQGPQCKCGSDEHWIPSAQADRIYTCTLCGRPVGIDIALFHIGKQIEKLKNSLPPA
jgi:hypothetical protein